jgi:hypothetical protein
MHSVLSDGTNPQSFFIKRTPATAFFEFFEISVLGFWCMILRLHSRPVEQLMLF